MVRGTPERNTAQWDHAFADGAMFKHGNMGQGIYLDPARDFCGMYFGLATNDEKVAGIDHSPGYLREAAKLLGRQVTITQKLIQSRTHSTL